MTKAMRELMASLSDAEQRARDAITNGNATDAEEAMKDVRDLRARITALKELEAAQEREFEASRPKGEQKDREELQAQYRNVFLKTLRNRRLTAEEQSLINAYRKEIFNIMHEGGATAGVGQPDDDTSIVVPVDMQTRINELIKQEINLAQYVRYEPVTTLSGSRVLEKRARHTPFAKIEEYAELQELAGPQFVPVTYEVVKRGGFLPLTRELIRDNDANLLAYVERWLAQKVPATYNSLILPILNDIDPVEVTGVDEIKALKNVEITPVFSNRATWYTNQDGFNWLDTQKDGNGRYLLQDDIATAGGKMLLSRPVVVIDNELWPSDEEDGTAPLVFGDLYELIVHFQRQGIELASTQEGGEAWRRDTLEMRALMRDDFVVWDEAAAVAGKIDLASGDEGNGD